MLGGSTPVHFVRKLRVKGAWGRRSRGAWEFLKVCEGCHINLETECGKQNEPIICGSFLPAFLQKKTGVMKMVDCGMLYHITRDFIAIKNQLFTLGLQPEYESGFWARLISWSIMMATPIGFAFDFPKKWSAIRVWYIGYWLNQIMQDAWWCIVGMERNDLHNIHTQLSK